MKTAKYLLALMVVILMASCDRSGIFEEYDHRTPWELHIVVYSDSEMTDPVADADIYVYKEEEDRDNNTNVFLQGKSNASGKLVFTAADFGATQDKPDIAKGIYFMRVTKGTLQANETTRYLLMNDGHTYQYIVLK